MHSQDQKARNVRHILEFDFFSIDANSEIANLAKRVTSILTSPESAILLSDIYDNRYNLNNGSDIEDLIGPNLYRDTESLDNYNRLSILIETYLATDIKKHFGLSIDDFIDCTPYITNLLLNIANDRNIKLAEEAENLNEELNSEMDISNILGIEDS